MNDMKVSIKELDQDNWYACCELEVLEQQKMYMEPNAVSIAQSKFESNLKTYAIYLEDLIIGFAMYNTEMEELDSYWIYRIMIDKQYQGTGIGKVAMQLVINEMAKLSKCKSIAVGYHPENQGAHNLYAKLGFIDRGNRFGKEMAVVLEINV